MKRQKTFKFGEWGYSDIYKVIDTPNYVRIMTNGRNPRNLTFYGGYKRIELFFNEETTPYYTDKVMEWLERVNK